MTNHEMDELERKLLRMFSDQLDEFQASFVRKEDFLKVTAQVDKHEDAYRDWVQGKKWLLRLGVATLLSAALSPHIAWIAKIFKILFG